MTTEPEKKFLKPAVAGLIVINPATSKPLPAEGALVEMTSYWHRCVMHGDAVEADAPEPADKKSETKSVKVKQ